MQHKMVLFSYYFLVVFVVHHNRTVTLVQMTRLYLPFDETMREAIASLDSNYKSRFSVTATKKGRKNYSELSHS